jgi:SAM-dependent methyltransferase
MDGYPIGLRHDPTVRLSAIPHERASFQPETAVLNLIRSLPNVLKAQRQRPEHGWDPNPAAYAAEGARGEWAKGTDQGLLDDLERRLGGFAGKRVLDLGGGPGQYAVAFAARGADVTWYDVSQTYLDIARAAAEAHGVDIDFRIGYFDEAPAVLEPYDLVFNRICWYYGHSDWSMAEVIHTLTKPGGWAHVIVQPAEFKAGTLGAKGRVRAWANNALGIKVGHPWPPHGRAARLLAAYDPEQLLTDYTDPADDRIWYQRRWEAPGRPKGFELPTN